MQIADYLRSACCHRLKDSRKWWLAVAALLLALLLMFQMSPVASAEEVDTNVIHFVEPAPGAETTQGVPTEGDTKSGTNPEPEPTKDIQGAVDDVISKLTSTDTSATIRVAEGTYTGNLTINTEKLTTGVTLDENFTLIIEHEDIHGTPDTDCGTEVTFDKVNIAIDNLNVNLVGIYFCLNSLIEAKNSHVGIYGTTGNDNVIVQLDDKSSIGMNTGAGDDTINVSYTQEGTGGGGKNVIVNTGTGADYVYISSGDETLGSVTIHGKDITVDGNISANSVAISASDTSSTVNGDGIVNAGASVILKADINAVTLIDIKAESSAVAEDSSASEGAVNAVRSAARLEVQGNKTLKASDGTVNLLSKSTVSVVTKGKKSGISVIGNDAVLTIASGTTIEGKSVSIKSEGNVSGNTLTDNGIAATVVKHNVMVDTDAGSTIKSSGSVSVVSNAVTRFETKAVATNVVADLCQDSDDSVNTALRSAVSKLFGEEYASLLISGRQLAETTEGRASNAASYAYSFISQKNRAAVGKVTADGAPVTVNADGAMTIKTESDASAYINPGSDKYGNSFAISQIGFNQSADVRGKVSAGTLSVTAVQINDFDTIATPGTSDATILKPSVGYAGMLAISKVEGSSTAALCSSDDVSVAGTLSVEAVTRQNDKVQAAANSKSQFGAAFAFLDTGVNTISKIDTASGANVRANAVKVISEYKHDTDTKATCGADSTTKVADVSTAIFHANDKAEAFVGESTSVNASNNDIATYDSAKPACLYVYAWVHGDNDVWADSENGAGYFIVDTYPDGAVTAMSLNSTRAYAHIDGTADCTGRVVVRAFSDTTDDVTARGTPVGVDLYKRFSTADGGYCTYNKSNQNATASYINNLLNEFKDDHRIHAASEERTNTAVSSNWLSRNVLYTQDVGTVKYDDLAGKIKDALYEMLSPIVTGAVEKIDNTKLGAWLLEKTGYGAGSGEAQKDDASLIDDIIDGIIGGMSGIQYDKTATLAFSRVAHEAEAKVNGSVNAADVDITSRTDSDYAAFADGTTQTKGEKDSMTRSVAHLLNVNKSLAGTGSNASLTVTGGNVNVKAEIFQNVSDEYLGTCAARAISGRLKTVYLIKFLFSDDEKMTTSSRKTRGRYVYTGGAIATAVTRSECIAELGEGTKIVSSGNVSVVAEDKSKLTAITGLVFDFGDGFVYQDEKTTGDEDGEASDKSVFDNAVSGLMSAVKALEGTLGTSITTTFGIGGSHTQVYSFNTVSAIVGDNSNITGKSFDLLATKFAVTGNDSDLDYSSNLHDEYLFTVNGTGFINIGENKNGTSKIYIEGEEASTEPVDEEESTSTGSSNTKFFNTKQFLDSNKKDDFTKYIRSESYFLQAINGMIEQGTGFSLFNSASEDYANGGSVCALTVHNTVSAVVGNNVVITATEGDVNIKASNKADAMMVAGTLAKQFLFTGSGASYNIFSNEDVVLTQIGDNCVINVYAGNYNQKSRTNWYVLEMTSAQLAAKFAKNLTLSGMYKSKASNATTMAAPSNLTRALIGTGTAITAKAVNVFADAYQQIDMCSTSDAISNITNLIKQLTDSKGNSSVSGSTMAILFNEMETKTEVGASSTLTADNGDVIVKARAKDNTTNNVDSMSLGFSKNAGGTLSSKGVQGASVVSVLFSKTKTYATVGNGAQITARNGSIKVYTDVNSICQTLSMGKTVGSKCTGMSIVGSAFIRTNTVTIGSNAILKADKDIIIDALADEYATIFGAAFAAAIPTGNKNTGKATSGVIGISFSYSKVNALVKSGAKLYADGSVCVDAMLNGNPNLLGGGISVGKEAMGVVVDAGLYFNTVTATVESGAELLSRGKSSLNYYNRAFKRYENRKGVYVHAQAKEALYQIAVSVSGGVKGALNGCVNFVLVKSNISSVLSGSASAGYESFDANAAVTDAGGDSEVSVEADDEAAQTDFAGGLAISGEGAKGATIIAIVYKARVLADAGHYTSEADRSIIRATGDVSVKANEDIDLWLLSIACSIGAGGTTLAGDINVAVFNSNVTASAGGIITAKNICVDAINDSHFVNIGVGVSFSGTSTGATVVVVFTYFTAETYAYVKANAYLAAIGNITIHAHSKEYNTPDACGMGLSGAGTGLAGTIDLIISRVIARSYTEESVTLIAKSGNIEIVVDDTYQLTAVVVSLAGGMGSGISLGVMIGILNNNLSASVGAGSVINAGADVTVKSDTARVISTYVASVGLGSSAGVAPAANVIIAGSKLPKDAKSVLNDTGIDLKSKMNKSMDCMGSDNPSGTLDRDLESDDQSVKDVQPKDGWDEFGQEYQKNPDGSYKLDKDGKKIPVDYTDGLSSNDNIVTDKGDGGYNENTGDVDNNNGTDTTEVEGLGFDGQKSKSINNDASAAIINSLASVTAGGDLYVIANDCLCVEMLAGSIAVGGTAGIGIGVTVGVLSSSVSAQVANGAILSAGDDIYVKATSGASTREVSTDPFAEFSGRKKGKDGETTDVSAKRAKANEKISAKKDDKGNDQEQVSDATTSTIRLISLSVAIGGTGGFSVACAVLNVYSNVYAEMNGTVEKADEVNVVSGMQYGEVLCVVLGVAGAGTAAVSASVGFANFKGTVTNSIGPDAWIKKANGVNVRTNGKTNAVVAAASIAASGVGAGAAGVALVFNRTTVNNFIAGGAKVEAQNGTVNVTTDFEGAARAFIISVALSATFSIGATVAVVNNALVVCNYIGTSPAVLSAVKAGTVSANTINVKHNIHGTLKTIGVGVAGSMIALNGIVAVCFNNVSGISAINGMNINNGAGTKAGTVTVDANTNADATVISASLAAGLVAGGASVVIAKAGTLSEALVNVANCTMLIGNLVIGESSCSSKVLITEVSGSFGAGAVVVNVGIAKNMAHFISKLTGTSSGTLKADSVKIEMNGNAYANTFIATAAIGAAAGGVGVGLSILKAVQEALVEGNAKLEIGSLSVKSTQNQTDPGNTFSIKIGKTDLINFTFDKMCQAIIYGVKVGLVAAGANVVIANADATCRAKVDAADLTVTSGKLSVSAKANTNANVKTEEYGVSAVSVGAMTGFAFANGTVEAILASHDNGVVRATGGAEVLVDYNANSTAVVKPSMGGLLGGFSVNVAIAKIKTKANALIQGNGTINAESASISVKSKGLVSSDAIVKAAKIDAGAVKVGVNVVLSVLKATQIAMVSGVNVQGGSLNVISIYNTNKNDYYNPSTPSINTAYGAKAVVGAALASVGLANIKVNLAWAYSTSTVKALVGDASVDMSGDAYVTTYATSYAQTGIDTPDFEISGLSAACNYLYSYAQGTYESGIDSGSSANALIKANNLCVYTGCNTEAQSVTGAFGAAIGAISIKINIARATVISSANAYLKGAGKIDVANNLTVRVIGTGHAYTRVIEPAVSFSLVDIAASVLTSRLGAIQNAFTDISGEAKIGGNLSVLSEFDASADDKGADSQVGNSEGFSISFVKGAGNEANSLAVLVNRAGLYGNGGKITAGSAAVKATSKTRSNAVALKPVSLSVAEVCVNYAVANTADVTEAFIGKKESELKSGERSITVETTTGGVDVEANSETKSYTEFASGGGLSLASGSVSDVVSYIGAEGYPQTARAYIGAGANVTAKGNINVKAVNVGTVTARMTQGFKVSAIAINSSNVATKSWYLTEAYVSKNATVESTNGNVSIIAEDKPSADALVNGNGVGVLLSADVKAALNDIVQQVRAEVEENAMVIGKNNVSIQAISNDIVSTYTEAKTGGLFAAGSLNAHTVITRNVSVKAGKKSTIRARYGNLILQAEAGRKDSISTRAEGSAAGLAGIGGAVVSTNLTSNVDTEADDDSHLYADFGTVSVKAIIAENYLSTNGRYDAKGAVAGPNTLTWTDKHQTIANLNANVRVKNALVRGTNTDIAAEAKELCIDVTAYSKAGGAGAEVVSKAISELNLNTIVTISGSKIQAYNTINLWTNATPTSNGTHINVNGYGKYLAAIGYAHAYATLNGRADSKLDIGNSEIRGYNVSLSNTGFNGSISIDANASGVALIPILVESPENNLARNSGATISSDSVIHISGGAMGIRAEVDVNGESHYTGSASAIYSGSVDRDTNTVIINGKLTPMGAGSLMAPGIDLNGVTVFDNAAYTLDFESYFKGTVGLPAMDMSMSAGEHGNARFNATNCRPGYINFSNFGYPYSTLINILVRNGGNIKFSNVICNETGKTYIAWVDEKGNNGTPGDILSSKISTSPKKYEDEIESISSLWTEYLEIVNVRNIGESQTDYTVTGEGGRVVAPFANNSYVQILMGNDAVIEIIGTGNIYLEPIMTSFVRNYNLDTKNAEPTGKVTLKSVVTNGLVDLSLTKNMKVNYMPGAGGVTIDATNSTPVFLPNTGRSNSVTLNEAGLEYYYADTTDGVKRYVLPDGTNIYTDAVSGKFLRLETEEMAEKTSGGNFILASETDDKGNTSYVYITPEGEVVVEAGYSGSYVIYLEYVDTYVDADSLKLVEGHFNSDVVKEATIVDLERYIDRKWTAVTVLGDKNQKYAMTEVTAADAQKLFNSDYVKVALSGGAFGDYNTDETLKAKVKFYYLNNDLGSAEGKNDFVIALYDGIEYLGVYSFKNGYVENPLRNQTEEEKEDGYDPSVSTSGTKIYRTYEWVGEEDQKQQLSYFVVSRDYKVYDSKTGLAVIDSETGKQKVETQYFYRFQADFSEKKPVNTAYYYRYYNEQDGIDRLYELDVIKKEGTSTITGATIELTRNSTTYAEGIVTYKPVSIQLKESEKQGKKLGQYQITESISLTTDGKLARKTIVDAKSGAYILVTSDPATNYFQYRFADGSTVTFDGKDAKSSTVNVTLSGRALNFEQLTSKVAKTADGKYYYYVGDGVWAQANYNPATGEVTYGGKSVLKIEIPEPISGETYRVIYTTYDDNGTAMFRITMANKLIDGDVQSEIVETENLVNLDKTVYARYLTKGSYEVDYVESGKKSEEKPVNTDIFLRFGEGYIILTKDDESQKEYNFVSEKDIYEYFQNPEKGSAEIGTELSDVGFKPNKEKSGKVYELNIDDDKPKTVYTDRQYKKFSQSGADFEFAVGATFKPGCHYVLVFEDGNIIGTDLVIEEGAYVAFSTITSGKNVILNGTTTVGKNVVDNEVLPAYFQVDSCNDIIFDKMVILAGAVTDMATYNNNGSGGYLKGNEVSVNGEGAKLTATITRDIILPKDEPTGEVNAPLTVKNGAVVNLVSTNGGFYGSYIADGKSRENLERDNRILPVENAEVYIQVSEFVIITEVDLNHGTVSLESTNSSVYFDKITARSNVIIAAAEDIDVLHKQVENRDNHAVIEFLDRIYEGDRYDGSQISGTSKTIEGKDVDVTSTLVLRAGRNIGRSDCWIYIDVPSEVVPVIQVATNFYIDAQAQSLLDWNLYKYWVTSGYGVEKINIGFDEYESGTAVDYLSYSDVTYFRSLLDLDDSNALAQWIMTRSDDVNKTKNSFHNYVNLDTAIRHLTEKKDGEELTVKDVESAISKTAKISAELSEILKKDYDDEVQRRKEAKEDKLTSAEAVKLLKDSFVSALKDEKISDSSAKAVLVAMLDDEIVIYDGSLGNLMNFLFQTSSFYSKDLESLLDEAAKESGKNQEKAQAAMEANKSGLAEAEKTLTEANNNQTGILDAIHQAISDGIKLSSSVKQEGKVLPDSAAYKSVYTSAVNSVNTYLASVEAAAGDEKAEAEALETLKKELKSEFESLSKQYKDFRPEVSVDTSAGNISGLAKNYAAAKTAADSAREAYDSLRDINRALAQRLAEVSDSYQTESMAKIAKRLDDILKNGGEWDVVSKALEDGKNTLEASRKAYESLKGADSYGEAQAQAKARMLKAVADYEAATADYIALYSEVYTLANTHYDQQTRPFSLNIGEIYGEANLYNTGDISITVDPKYAHSTVYKNVQERAEAGEITIDYAGQTSDIILANIRSENGNVSIVNNGGSIYGADLDKNAAEEGNEWIYRNDGKDYRYRYDRTENKWYEYDESGESRKEVEMTKAPVWDSAFTRNWFAGTTEEFQNSLVKNFEKVHVYGNELTISAKKNVGTSDRVLLTESHATTPTKVANASINMDPFSMGKDYWRFDDYQINIYDQISGKGNYIKENLSALIEKMYVMAAQRETSLMLAGDGSIVSAADGYDVSEKDTKVYVPVEVSLIEYTFANGIRTWGIEVSVRHDWIRANDVESAGKIKVIATEGNVWLDEYAGDINGGRIEAGKDATVNIPGYACTSDNRMEVKVGGTLNLNVGEGSIYLKSEGSLNLNGYCPTSHYEIDTVMTVDGKGSIALHDMNRETKVLTGYTKSMGDVTVTTRGDIGTSDVHFVIANTVDEDSVGIVSFKGLNTYITGVREDEKANNIALNECVVDGNLVLDNSGKVINKNINSGSKYNDLMNELVAKQETYNKKSDALDKAEALKASVDNLAAKENVEKAEIARSSAESTLSNAKLVLEAADSKLADAKKTLEAARKVYEEKLKEKTADHYALTELVKVEEKLAMAQEERNAAAADVEAAEQNLQACEQELSKAQTYWDGMADYATRETAAAQKRVDDAKSALTEAENNKAKAQEKLDNLPATATEEEKQKARKAVEDAETQVADCKKEISDAETWQKTLASDLVELEAYVSNLIAKAEYEKATAAKQLDALKALIEAQDRLNEAEANAQATELYASEHPDDAIAQKKAEIARNNTEAARYVQSASALVNEYSDITKSTEAQRANAAAILKEAQQTLALVELGNSYLSNGDAEYAIQNGLTDSSTELEKLTAVAEQQKLALAIVESVELLAAKSNSQATTTLHAGKDLLNATQDAYNQQVILTQKQKELDAAETEHEEADAAWVKATKNYRLDDGKGEIDQAKLQTLFRDAENGAQLKAAWLRLKNAEAAEKVAKDAFDDQVQKLADANAVKETKQNIWAKVNELNDALDTEEKRVSALNAAEAEKSSLENQQTAQQTVVSGRKTAAENELDELINTLEAEGNPDLLQYNGLTELRNNVEQLMTLSEDELDDYAAQLKARLLEESTVTEAELSEQLDDIFDALRSYYAERTKLTDIGRAIAEKDTVIKALESAESGNKEAIEKAKKAQSDVIGGLSEKQSDTRAEAAPVLDETDRENRNTAENPNLKVNGNAVISAGGDFGEAENPLGVEVAGTIDLVTGGETGLTSTKDLKLIRAMGTGDASFTTLGSISNVSGGDGIMITGEDITFNAIPGTDSDGTHNVGAGRALNVAATGLGGNADNMFVNNYNVGNTELSDLHVVDTAVLNLNGDVSQKKDAVLTADTLKLNTKGSIGDANDSSEPNDIRVKGISTPVDIEKKKGAITVNADKLDVSGNSANLHSINPNTAMSVNAPDGISVTSVGNLVPNGNSVLNGKELYLYALGNVGTPFDGFLYTGKLTRCDTVYGMKNVKPVSYGGTLMNFIWTDLGGALGYFSKYAKLIITDLKPAGDSDAAAMLKKAEGVSGYITGYNVKIIDINDKLYNGYAILMLDVGEQEDSEVIYGLYLRDGRLEVLKGFIRNGYAVFSVNGFDTVDSSSIAIVTEEALSALGLSAGDVVTVVNYTTAYDYYLRIIDQQLAA